MSTGLERVEEGRQCIERIFNRIASDRGIVIQNPEWKDKKSQFDPMTHYCFTFRIDDDPKCIVFTKSNLDDCPRAEKIIRDIESKICNALRAS